jgi:3-methyladenine DNA glycosylase AlkD
MEEAILGEVEETMRRVRRFLVDPEVETNQEDLFDRFFQIIEMKMKTSPDFKRKTLSEYGRKKWAWERGLNHRLRSRSIAAITLSHQPSSCQNIRDKKKGVK